jgi:hypothetical protein
VTRLSVRRRGTRLRRLALRYCHGLANVAADVSELRTFEYRGPVPPSTFRRAAKPKHRLSNITSCEMDFCGDEAASHPPESVASLRDFFHLFSGATHLQLKSARLGGAVFSRFPVLATHRELELTRILTDDDTAIIGTIIGVLEHTPSLETGPSWSFGGPVQRNEMRPMFCSLATQSSVDYCSSSSYC